MAMSLSATISRAQMYDAEFSYFEPLNGFDDVITATGDGFYFNYDRLYWSAHSERVSVGSPTAIVRHFETYGPGADNGVIIDQNGDGIQDSPIPVTVNPITRPILSNGLQQVFPRARFEMGNRFEFGSRNDGDEWSITINSPFDITQDQSYGILVTGQDATTGLFEPSSDSNNTIPENNDVDTTNDVLLPLQAASPLGSVVILFDYPPGFMDGFLDVRDPVQSFLDDTDGDGFLDGDGVADDINQNGVAGPDGGNFAIDFGDLVELPTAFHRVDIRSTLETTGLELMRGKQLRDIRSGRGLTFLYGLRYLRFKDEFFVAGHGGVLGESSWDTEIRNNLFGPQVGAKWTQNCGRWGYVVDGRAFLPVNMEDWEQDVKMGEDLIPSQHNHPLYFSPTVAAHGKRKYEFAPMGELRATASYQLTKGVSLNLGFNGMYVDGIRRAATHVKYELPNMGFTEGRRESMFLAGVNFGFSFVH